MILKTMHANIKQKAIDQLASDSDDQTCLNSTLRLLSKWRSALIQNTLLAQHGSVIMEGPFQGMRFLSQSAEGCHIAKLIGCYEQPLQPHIEEAIKTKYSRILNIGCAEGYYAVGMAMRMLTSKVLAFDLNPKAQEVCKALAVQNGVSERVSVGALFKAKDFEQYVDEKVLVLCDIEGAERELINPELSPELKSMDIIVESHECLSPGITQLLIDRFKETHLITLIQDDGQRRLENPHQWFLNLAHLDQLLATWEWRSGPTPWLVMKTIKAV
jgi:hypothetical protein